MSLNELRDEIDRIDDELLRLFAERMEVSAQIAAYKKEKKLPILDRTREAEKLDSLEGKVQPELVPYARTLYDTLFDLSRRHQKTQGIEER